MNDDRKRVLAIRRLGPPEPRFSRAAKQEADVRLQIYSTSRRRVQRTPRTPPVERVAWDLLADSQPGKPAA